MQRVFHARKHIIFRVIEQQTRRKAILKRQQLTCWHLMPCILPGACREVARLFLCTLPMVLETTMVLCPRSTLPPPLPNSYHGAFCVTGWANCCLQVNAPNAEHALLCLGAREVNGFGAGNIYEETCA